MSQKTHCISVRRLLQRKTFRKITPVYFGNYLKLYGRNFIGIYFNPEVLYDYSAQFTAVETFRDKTSVFLFMVIIFSL